MFISHLTQLEEMAGNLMLQVQILQPAWPRRKNPTAIEVHQQGRQIKSHYETRKYITKR